MTKFVATIVTDDAHYCIGYSAEAEFTEELPEKYPDVKWARLSDRKTGGEVMFVQGDNGKLFEVVKLS